MGGAASGNKRLSRQIDRVGSITLANSGAMPGSEEGPGMDIKGSVALVGGDGIDNARTEIETNDLGTSAARLASTAAA